jgi:hypothetical protein
MLFCLGIFGDQMRSSVVSKHSAVTAYNEYSSTERKSSFDRRLKADHCVNLWLEMANFHSSLLQKQGLQFVTLTSRSKFVCMVWSTAFVGSGRRLTVCAREEDSYRCLIANWLCTWNLGVGLHKVTSVWLVLSTPDGASVLILLWKLEFHLGYKTYDTNGESSSSLPAAVNIQQSMNSQEP